MHSTYTAQNSMEMLQANVSTPSAVKKDKLINDKQVIPKIKIEKENCAKTTKPKKQVKVNFHSKFF